MKNILAKAEELVEEKKHAATSLLEKQTSKHDFGSGGVLGEVENSNGHVANNMEHNIEGSVHKLEFKTKSLTRKLDNSVDGGNAMASSDGIMESMRTIHDWIDKIKKVIHILHEVADKVHRKADKVFKVANKFRKATYEVIHIMQERFKGMVKVVSSLIPIASITKVVKGMLKGSLTAWKKAIKLTIKVPYTITKAVLNKTSKVMKLIFGNEVPELVDPVSTSVIQVWRTKHLKQLQNRMITFVFFGFLLEIGVKELMSFLERKALQFIQNHTEIWSNKR
ncbi:hypothetical protein ACI65C_000928 [Semiaphis heraclei]